MAFVSDGDVLKLDGKTSFVQGGEGVEWFDGGLGSLFLDPEGGESGIRFKLDLRGRDWTLGVLDVNQATDAAVRIVDKTKGSGGLFKFLALGGGNNTVELTRTSVIVLHAMDGNDTVRLGSGTYGHFELFGGNNTMVTGSSWVQTIHALGGNDTVTIGSGGAGTLELGDGRNVVKTGKGWVFAVVTRNGDDKVTIGNGGAATVTVGHGNNVVKTGKEWVGSIVSYSGNDKVSLGSGGSEAIATRGGDDLVVLGNLTSKDLVVNVSGGSGTDTVSFAKLGAGIELPTLDLAWEVRSSRGNFLVSGFENVIGTAKSDRIGGSVKDNVIDGGRGDDVIGGIGGADDLKGGKGADQFVFTDILDSTVAAAGRDIIRDFSRSQKDKIDLEEIDAVKGKGNQAFDFIAAAAFTKTAGELRYEQEGSSTFVYGDVDGDGEADFAIELAGSVALKASDFIL